MSTTFPLCWGRKVSADYQIQLVDGCKGLGWLTSHANWLQGCIGFESARSFRADVQNAAGSGATGLIQFMPKTAMDMGTTVENLALLSPEEQLYYVFKYFDPMAKRINSFSDMYMAILWPSAIGQPDSYVIATEGGVVYRQNAGLDANNDGKVTKAEAAANAFKVYTEGNLPQNVATATW